jgi:hypothetical protein
MMREALFLSVAVGGTTCTLYLTATTRHAPGAHAWVANIAARRSSKGHGPKCRHSRHRENADSATSTACHREAVSADPHGRIARGIRPGGMLWVCAGVFKSVVSKRRSRCA